MSSGGGGSQNTTTTQSGPPAAVLQNYQQLTGAATNLATQNPLALYGGSMVAGFSPAQQAGFSEVANSQGIGMPFLNAAGQEFGQATTPLYNTVQNYESPYTRDVTSALQNLFAQQNAQQQQQIQGSATSHGAYGGDREAVAQALAAQQENLAQAPTLAQTLQQGYSTGLSADEAQAWLASQAGFGIGALGPQAQSEALTGANALMGIGGLQQQLAQEQMNIPYQQFQAGQAFPYQSLGFLAPIVEGTGSLSGGQSSTTSPGPTALSQIGGLASAGAGLAGLFTGGNNTTSGVNDFGGGGNFIDPSTGLNFKEGGRIGRAMGGGLGVPGAMKIPTGVPNIDLSYIPQGMPGGAVGGILSPMQPDVTKTQTTSSGGGGGGIGLGDILGAGKFIAGLFAHGGRIGFDDGGTIPVDQQRRGIGLPPVPQINIDQIIKPGPEIKGAGPPKPPSPAASSQSSASDFSGIGSALKSAKGLFGGSDTASSDTSAARGGGIGHYQSGGQSTVPVQVAAQFGGANPAMQNQLAALQGLPVEKLQEMQAQYPPNTPQGQLVAMALAQRHAQPGTDQGNPPPQQSGGMGQQQASQQATTGSYGGTAHAAGGSVSDGMGYVTEDELDPHPVVDHSGDTVKIRYPSEGKVLDLGLPSISGRRALAAGGSGGSSTGIGSNIFGGAQGSGAGGQGQGNIFEGGGGNGWVGGAAPGFAAQGQISLPGDFQLPAGWTLGHGGAGDQFVTAPDGSITYLGQIPQGMPTALTSSHTWDVGATPPPASPPPPAAPPPPAPSPSAPQLPPTPQVSTFGPNLNAANGVGIPQINPAAFSIQNLMNDPWTGQPYGAGQGNGQWFNPLDQWHPPGTNLPLGNVGGFPAFTPNLPSMSLIQGARRGGRIGFDDGGDVTDQFGDPSIPAMPPSTADTLAGATTPETPVGETTRPFRVSEEATLRRVGPKATAPKDVDVAEQDVGGMTIPPLSPPAPPEPSKGQTVSAPTKGIGATAPAGQIGVNPTTVSDSGAYAPDDSDTYQPPGIGAPVPRGTDKPIQTTGYMALVGTTPPQDVYAVGDSHAWGLQANGGLKGTRSAHLTDPGAENTDATVGRGPSGVYKYITSRPADYWKGKNVVLSTGVANDPSQVGFVPWQLSALKEAGANVVGISGFTKNGARGTDMTPTAAQISDIAAKSGVPFGGIFTQDLRPYDETGTGAGAVHLTPQGYQKVGNWYQGAAQQAPSPSGIGAPQQQNEQQGTPITRMVDQLVPISDDPGQRKAALGFKALLPLETAQNPNAVSPAGAIGIAQIIPSTGRELGLGPEDLRDPNKAIPAGLKYFTDRLNQGNGDLKAAWVGYNAGPDWENKWLASGRNDGILPAETQAYLRGAQANYEKLNGGTQLADIWHGSTGTSPGRVGIGRDTTNAPISDAPPSHEPGAGIGTEAANRNGIGYQLARQNIERRGDLGDETGQHHGLTLHDMAIPLLIAGLTTLSSRSPNAMAEGFRAAAPYFTAAEKMETNAALNQVRAEANLNKQTQAAAALDLKAQNLQRLADAHKDDLAVRTEALHSLEAARDAAEKARELSLQLARVKASKPFAGFDPQSGQQGTWQLDPEKGEYTFTAGQTVGKPPAVSTFQQKREAYLQQHPGDDAGALNFAAGQSGFKDAAEYEKEVSVMMHNLQALPAYASASPQALRTAAEQVVITTRAHAPGAQQQPVGTPPAAAPTQAPAAPKPAEAAPAAPQWGTDPHKLPDGTTVYRDPSQGNHWFKPDHTPYEAPAQAQP